MQRLKEGTGQGWPQCQGLLEEGLGPCALGGTLGALLPGRRRCCKEKQEGALGGEGREWRGFSLSLFSLSLGLSHLGLEVVL